MSTYGVGGVLTFLVLIIPSVTYIIYKTQTKPEYNQLLYESTQEYPLRRLFVPARQTCPVEDLSHIKSKENLQPFHHVFIIMLENMGNKVIIGNEYMPFINLLIENFGFAAEYYGVTHTSLPNYIALTSGSNWWSHNDSTEQVFNHTCIADQLEQNGQTWRNYAQSIPYAGYKETSIYPPNSSFLWFQDHCPFLFYPQIFSQSDRLANVVPLHQLENDLENCTTPHFAFITPDACHDMHGGSDLCPSVHLYPNEPNKLLDCLDANVTLEDCQKIRYLWKTGDDFVREWVTKIIQSPSWIGNSVIFVTFDESNFNEPLDEFIRGGPNTDYIYGSNFTFDGHSFFIQGLYGGGHIPLIVISRNYPYHVVSHRTSNHYNLLKTIEASWGLDYLGFASDNIQVSVLSEFFSSSFNKSFL
ncbi:acid phosphatase [Galdieria sulphuraria]|uniref:Acid phosphatase n=1 Tax=Galdieria sulphuraria TaxID=130081 RepID=M2Y2C4_GALSU|nr:acid phosphatase [Galdieria sulphuraria]EME30113.1 acid phosphatase [Galdieria sulphuraria]|eukprot:XP_005706633.1 acid phosphatase [Galdieria sulphuraria]